MTTYKNIVCGSCKHEQGITDNSIYQDIAGKFIICKKCNEFVNVEPKKQERELVK